MAIKWNKTLAKKYIESIGYIYDINNPEKIKAITKITIIKDNYLYYTDIHKLQRGVIPDRFSKTNIHTITNIKTWLKEYNKNIELISKFYIGSKEEYIWECKVCNEQFYKSWDCMNDLTVINSCVYCSNRKAGISNCVATLKPYLIEEWHYYKNDNYTLWDFTCGMDYEAWWQCKNNPKHTWQASIKNRTNNNSGCPYCSGLYASTDNNLLLANPELCEEWDYKKNDKLPEEYTPGSGESVWWICKKCNNNWNAIISSRSVGNGCPYCAGKIATLDNCLATKRPDLIEEWHPILNGDLTPYDITYGSGTEVWWICDKGHEWEAKIGNRTANNQGCPRCKSSKGEDFIYNFLNIKDIANIPQHKFPNCRNIRPLPFDFYLLDYYIAIEYQGIQHYEPVEYFGGEIRFKLQQKLDQIKRDYCNNNNIKLIEIPYWDFDNIEKILNKELNLLLKVS